MASLEIAVIDIPDDSALTVFSGDFDVTIGPLLAGIKIAVESFHGDIATREGRDEIASFAYKLARSRTALDAAGKRVNDNLKKLPKVIDANRRRAWETLEGWQKRIRQPLDDFESREKARTDRHLSAIERLRGTGSGEFPITMTSVEIRAILANLQDMTIDAETCEEFETDYRIEREQACARVARSILAKETWERDQAELARLRLAAEAQEAAERERQAEATRQERARQAEIDAERNAREAAERATREAEAARLRAENDARIAAERAAREAAEREAAELRRQEVARAAEAAEAEKRERSIKRRAAIHRSAADAISAALRNSGLELGLLQPDQVSVAIVKAIAKGDVPAVSINY